MYKQANNKMQLSNEHQRLYIISKFVNIIIIHHFIFTKATKKDTLPHDSPINNINRKTMNQAPNPVRDGISALPISNKEFQAFETQIATWTYFS